MAIERQKTFKTNVTKTIDEDIEKFLRENAVDPAAIQIAIDNGNGIKTATVTYGDRELLKNLYEQQGRTYSDSDAVTYCHVKDFVTALSNDLDKEVNDFLSNENIGVISISRYFSQINQGAFIFYIDLEEQKAKMQEKQKEVEKAREELAQKLAKDAVKDVKLEDNDTVNKYSEVSLDNTQSQTSEEDIKTAGLVQTGEVTTNSKFTTTTATATEGSQTITLNNNVKNTNDSKPEKKKKFFGK